MFTTVMGRDSGQRLLQPCACGSGRGHKEVFSCHIPISPGLSTARTHHHEEPGANVWPEQGKIPWVLQGTQDSPWTPVPLLEHH